MTRFRLIDSHGEEVVLAEIRDLARAVAKGEVGEGTMVFDANNGRWQNAGELDSYAATIAALKRRGSLDLRKSGSTDPNQDSSGFRHKEGPWADPPDQGEPARSSDKPVMNVESQPLSAAARPSGSRSSAASVPGSTEHEEPQEASPGPQRYPSNTRRKKRNEMTFGWRIVIAGTAGIATMMLMVLIRTAADLDPVGGGLMSPGFLGAVAATMVWPLTAPGASSD